MTDRKKSFFDELTLGQMKDMHVKNARNSRDLVEQILSLDSEKESVAIHQSIIPQRFYQGTRNSAQAARKCYKHGHYIPLLNQPHTIQEAIEAKRLPHEIREYSFDRLLNSPEENIASIGYEFKPIKGRDRVKRRVPFAWLLEGARLFSYAMTTPEEITVKPYDIARRIESEGAMVFASIPSRREKEPRYKLRLGPIAVKDNPNKYAILWGLSSTYAEGRVPDHSLYNIKYEYEDRQEQSGVLTFYPQDIAAMQGIARHYMINEDNTIPWDTNPFAKPSLLAANYYLKLCNNAFMVDPTLREKHKTRQLYVAEKSILLARLVGHLGTENTLFWKAGRDPKLHQYSWEINDPR